MAEITVDHVTFLKSHLRIEVTCEPNQGTPEICVKLWLGDACISESRATVPAHDPEDW